MEQKGLYTAKELEDVFSQINAEFAAKIVQPLLEIEDQKVEENNIEQSEISLEPIKRPTRLNKIEKIAKYMFFGSSAICVFGTGVLAIGTYLHNQKYEDLSMALGYVGLLGAVESAAIFGLCDVLKKPD